MTTREAREKKRDDASARLGEKMLQGWTLLATTCPVEDCFTPLVRSQQGDVYCVNCGQYVVTEEEAQRHQQEQAALEQQQLEAAQTAMAQLERERTIRDRAAMMEQQKQAQEQAFMQRQSLDDGQHQSSSESTIIPTAHHATGAAKRKSDQVPISTTSDDAVLLECRRRTLAALYQKVEELTRAIAPHADDWQHQANTIKAITDLVQVIHSLQAE